MCLDRIVPVYYNFTGEPTEAEEEGSQIRKHLFVFQENKTPTRSWMGIVKWRTLQHKKFLCNHFVSLIWDQILLHGMRLCPIFLPMVTLPLILCRWYFLMGINRLFLWLTDCCSIYQLRRFCLLGKASHGLGWGLRIGSDYGIACAGRRRKGLMHCREQPSGSVVTTCCQTKSTAVLEGCQHVVWAGRCHSNHPSHAHITLKGNQWQIIDKWSCKENSWTFSFLFIFQHTESTVEDLTTGCFFWLVPPRKVLTLELVPPNRKNY